MVDGQVSHLRQGNILLFYFIELFVCLKSSNMFLYGNDSPKVIIALGLRRGYVNRFGDVSEMKNKDDCFLAQNRYQI